MSEITKKMIRTLQEFNSGLEKLRENGYTEVKFTLKQELKQYEDDTIGFINKNKNIDTKDIEAIFSLLKESKRLIRLIENPNLRPISQTKALRSSRGSQTKALEESKRPSKKSQTMDWDDIVTRPRR